MAFHKFKGWEHGPEDATHFSVQDVGVPWLKVDNEGVYFAWFWPLKNWEWAKYERYAERHLEGAIVKHPAVEPLGIEVINGVGVNWEEAPEGATHYLRALGGRWRKIEDNKFYRWRGQWHEYKPAIQPPHTLEKYLEKFGEKVVARPLVEAPLPDGREWPENATHFNPSAGGFFINEGRGTYLHGVPPWKKFTEKGTLGYWLKDPETISRYVNVNKPEQPKPAPKKQVGWWS